MKKLKHYPSDFKVWVKLNYVKFMRRYEFTENPERGNWSLKELYEKYNDFNYGNKKQTLKTKIIQNNKDCSIDLIDELGDNIKSISYNAKKKRWTITYKIGATNIIGKNQFLEFIRII